MQPFLDHHFSFYNFFTQATPFLQLGCFCVDNIFTIPYSLIFQEKTLLTSRCWQLTVTILSLKYLHLHIYILELFANLQKKINISYIAQPQNIAYVTQSGKIGLIGYLKLSRNAGFKYLVCCSSPIVEAMCTKFSHILHQFLTFQSIHCASSKQLSFPPF